MGYINDNPDVWRKKRLATEGEIAQLRAELSYRGRWYKASTKLVLKWCQWLGYDYRALQSPRRWLKEFARALLKADHWSERRSLLQMWATISKRRQDWLLLLLYWFSQESKIQRVSALMARNDARDGSPFDELKGNHHNLDNLLLRLVFEFSNDLDRREPWIFRCGRTMIRRYLGPAAGDVTVNRLAGWARIAEAAAGIEPRTVATLAATYRQTAAPPSRGLQRRAFDHFKEAWKLKATAATWECIAVWAIDVCGVYYVARYMSYLLHP